MSHRSEGDLTIKAEFMLKDVNLSLVFISIKIVALDFNAFTNSLDMPPTGEVDIGLKI